MLGTDRKFILVEQSAAPEFLVKVLKAKMLLKNGKVKNSTAACQQAQVSRSAYYKYKDSVYAYEDSASANILTLYLSLQDRPGILSAVLSALYELHVNIMTVNQNIPADGVAAVTISSRIDRRRTKSEELLRKLSALDGVIAVNII